MPATALLPGGQAGNQYLAARFTKDLDVSSVLDGSPGAQASRLHLAKLKSPHYKPRLFCLDQQRVYNSVEHGSCWDRLEGRWT